MKKTIAILICMIIALLPVISTAADAQTAGSDGTAASGFETNLGWNVFPYDGNTFEIRDDGLYTKISTNTVFVRSDKYVDGTVSFTMDYEIDILSVIDNDYVWNEGWLYYTFSLGMPSEEDAPYDEAIKSKLYMHGGLTMQPKTDGGLYFDGNLPSQLPEELSGDVKHLTVNIEYAKTTELLTFTVNGIEVYSDYYEPEYHDGYIGIECAWTEMLVTKAIYTEYPEGLPSEKKATAEPQPTDAPAEPTDAPVDPTDGPAETDIAAATEGQSIATDKPSDTSSDNSSDKKSGSGSAWVWILIAVVAVAAVAAIMVILKKKKK